MIFSYGLFIISIIVIYSICTSIRIVPQAESHIVERLGTYLTTWETGLHLKMPFIDRVAAKISMKEQLLDFQPQSVITRDNVTMQIDSVVYFQITDPKLLTYGISNPYSAIENLTATTLRNIIGAMELDRTLTSRDTINSQITDLLDRATDRWGIKVNRVEVKNIIPPNSIRDAMEKQMKAERERRQLILTAEGKKQAAVTEAEGEKAAAILQAEAYKVKVETEAEGQAEAILTINKAKATAIAMLNNASPTASTLMLNGFTTLEKVSEGPSTKLIIPSELQSITSLAAAAKMVATSIDK